MDQAEIVKRVEQLGFASQRGEVKRDENPYSELAETVASGDCLAQSLAEAWWRGWDRASGGMNAASD
jgi:hypothetical protein